MHLWPLVLVVLMVVTTVVEGQRRGGGRRKGSRKGFSGKGSITNFKSDASRAYYSNSNGARITSWSHFENEYILGRKIVFICVAEGDPRPQITWFKDGMELYGHIFFQVHEWKEGELGVKSKMEIDPATQMDAGYYECQADNKYSIDAKGFRTDFSIVFD